MAAGWRSRWGSRARLGQLGRTRRRTERGWQREQQRRLAFAWRLRAALGWRQRQQWRRQLKWKRTGSGSRERQRRLALVWRPGQQQPWRGARCIARQWPVEPVERFRVLGTVRRSFFFAVVWLGREWGFGAVGPVERQWFVAAV